MSCEMKLAPAVPVENGRGERGSQSFAIQVQSLSKCYQIYDRPHDRLKQFVLPRMQKLAGVAHRRYYREFWALRDVSFEVMKGETVGIVGCNGSGKSTLLQLICGTLHPTTGHITSNGRIAALLELGSGFNPEFTGRENVYLNAAVLGLQQNEINERFGAIADFADIGEFMDQPVKTYSSGMMIRLAFAVSINVEPEVLVVDEALSVGDELFQRKCFSRFEELKSSGATILFVSHSGTAVVELCDRTLLLDAGEMIGFGKPKNIVAKYQKLLYAPPDKRSAVRQEIIRTCLAHVDESDGPLGPRRETAKTSRDNKHDAEEEREFLDPHLVPRSTMAYESRGALIRGVQIRTIAGEQVNCLRRGETYRYCYKVLFEQAAENVRFGMLIKTTSGMELGGSVSAASRKNAIPFVAAGTVARVEFAFSCRLNAGVYFLNAGVLGTMHNDEVYLHRVIDFATVRVMPEVASVNTGTVDFSAVPDYELLEAAPI
jgi:lipopolysaccharide transport system ATP-binding protein